MLICNPLQSPQPESCNGVDDDCDGTIDEDCDCTDGEAAACSDVREHWTGSQCCVEGEALCVAGTAGVSRIADWLKAWPGKVVLITPEGDPGPTFALPYREGGGFQSVTRAAGHDGAIIMAGTAWTREDGKQIQFTYLKSYDAGGNELATFVETSKEVQFGGYEFVEQEYVDFQRRWAVAPDGRVAAALSFADYRIHVWKADGTLDRIIERPDYPAVKRDGAETLNGQRVDFRVDEDKVFVENAQVLEEGGHDGPAGPLDRVDDDAQRDAAELCSAQHARQAR